MLNVAYRVSPYHQRYLCVINFLLTCIDITQIGSLFSLFLQCPIKAFAFISDINTVAPGTWEQGIQQMEALEKVISDLLDADTRLGN